MKLDAKSVSNQALYIYRILTPHFIAWSLRPIFKIQIKNENKITPKRIKCQKELFLNRVS